MTNEQAIRIAQSNLITLQASRIVELEKVIKAQADVIRRLEMPKPSEQARKEAQA